MELDRQITDTTLSTEEKVRSRNLKNSSGNVAQMLDWIENAPGWQGDDLDYCLEIEIVSNSDFSYTALRVQM